MLGDLVAQAAELGTLVSQLVELDADHAGSGQSPGWPSTRWSERRWPGPGATPWGQFTASLNRRGRGQEGTWSGRWQPLENAAKWSPPAVPWRSTCGGGRSRCATTDRASMPSTPLTSSSGSTGRRRPRALPGSGLGLSIVREAASRARRDCLGRARPRGWDAGVLPTAGRADAAIPRCSGGATGLPGRGGASAGGRGVAGGRPLTPVVHRPAAEVARRRAASTSAAAEDASRHPSTSASLPGSMAL